MSTRVVRAAADDNTIEHPPLVAHVNDCDECLNWLVQYMANVRLISVRQRVLRSH